MDIDDARVLAEGLMRQHGLRNWRLVFDRARTRAGVCRYSRSEIGLSRIVTELQSIDLVRDTILHEIAHALVGPSHAHDAVWKARCLAIGGNGRRCSSPSAPHPPAAWVGACSRGHEVFRHRRPSRPMACVRCAPTFDVENLFSWLFNGMPAPLSPAYDAELAKIRAARERAAARSARRAPASVAPATSPPERLPLRTLVELTGRGKYAGLQGRIVKRGRTRYHVFTEIDIVTVPFALVLPVHEDREFDGYAGDSGADLGEACVRLNLQKKEKDMESNESGERPEDVTRRLREETEAEKIRADALDEPESVAGIVDDEPGDATEAELIEAAGLRQPKSVFGLTNADTGGATEAERLEAAGLQQPESVISQTNPDTGTATDAERIRPDGL